ncbi:MAG: DEAD/DEAH box helicase [Nitriliruptorales bacterium]|nr:DEAD/DEAH box helicase [Nitriliruptorales bacterium]
MSADPLDDADPRDAFASEYPFELDPFQVAAIDHLVDGESVLVAAPTGAGKTVVGEFACFDAVARGGKCFYTTPIKALSNQKFRDLVQRHGEANVGLLTGDRSIRGEAPVVVMTTEVLRNMIYESSPTLERLRYVVLDEVHYLADRERGAVWEEVIIQLPASVQLAALSATVSNAEEFGDWLSTVRDGCHVIIEEERPVPLRHHYYVNDKIYPTFRAGKKGGASKEHRERAAQALAGVPNPDVVMLERRSRTRNRVTNRGRRMGPQVKLRYPDRWEVVEELRNRKWLPAITFVFSRQGCEYAVEDILRANLRLTTNAERDEIRTIVDIMAAELPDDDLAVLGYERWRGALERGVAAHHAGMVPAFKEIVEVCFQRGLLKMVYATETLALGINMPAKTVVIERLEKWNGDQHVLLTPGQYTQLTGRAGRRGIDRIGHAIVLYQRDIDFHTVAGLVGTRTYPLASSFEPSYNMAVNLLRHHSVEEAETLLGASFAQFQADQGVAGFGKRLVELEAGMRGYSRHLICEEGDWNGYWALRRELSTLEKEAAKSRKHARAKAVQDGIAALQPGDVLFLPWMGRRGLGAVVGIHLTRKGVPLAQVITDERALTRIGPRELDGPPVVVDRLRLPNRGNPRQHDYREIVTSKLRAIEPPEGWVAAELQRDPAAEERIEDLRQQLRSHPVHHCDQREEHERWQYRYDDLLDDAEKLRRQISQRTGSLVRQFERILAILTDLGYLDETPSPTEDGMLLASIYSQSDLLVAECVRRRILEDLGPAELAGLASLFLYEPRGGDTTIDPDIPTGRLAAAVDEVLDVADELRRREMAENLRPMPDLDGGFIGPAWRWASGASLDDALGDVDLTGGDFVRNVKQVADLVGQLRSVGDERMRRSADQALDALRRGIVEA